MGRCARHGIMLLLAKRATQHRMAWFTLTDNYSRISREEKSNREPLQSYSCLQRLHQCINRPSALNGISKSKVLSKPAQPIQTIQPISPSRQSQNINFKKQLSKLICNLSLWQLTCFARGSLPTKREQLFGWTEKSASVERPSERCLKYENVFKLLTYN